METFSIAQLALLAWTKLIGAVLLLAFAYAVWKQRRWWPVLGILAWFSGITLLLFGSGSLWWGNQGDELFIGAFLRQVLSGDWRSDFYYRDLPAFYPPLHFWIVGGIGKLLQLRSVVTTWVVGLWGTLLIALVGLPLAMQWLKRRSWFGSEVPGWVWWLWPLLTLSLLDVDNFLVKPYEILAAMGVVAWAMWGWGYFDRRGAASSARTAGIGEGFLLGVVGGILMLVYYLWWVVIAPVAVGAVMWALAKDWRGTLRRIWLPLVVMLAVVLPYALPLWQSTRAGWESWQGVFTVPQDLAWWFPWFARVDLKAAVMGVGLVSLFWSFRQPQGLRPLPWLLGSAYLWQLIGAGLVVGGGKPLMAGKPFLFFGTAVLAMAFLIAIAGAQRAAPLRRFVEAFDITKWLLIPIAALALWWSPLGAFSQDPVTLGQWQRNYERAPQAALMAEALAQAVPDPAQYTWLSSGYPELNLHLPLKYYLAHNPHFSHPAAQYSKRLNAVRSLTHSADAPSFRRGLTALPFESATALLLYYDQETKTYPIFLWEDAYPSGGREARLEIPARLISADVFDLIPLPFGWLAALPKGE